MPAAAHSPHASIDGRLSALQTMRALAALMVLAGHVLAEGGAVYGLDLFVSRLPWTRGVDLFFVISGFIVCLSAQRHHGAAGHFLWRRFWRIAPLYYIFTTLMVGALLLYPRGIGDTVFQGENIVASYFFFPVERPDGRVAPILSLGWTLNYEAWFYLIVAVGILAGRIKLVVSGTIIATVAIGQFWDPAITAINFWSNPITLEFLFGILLAEIWSKSPHRAHPGLALLGIVLGLLLLVFLHESALPRVIAAGIPAMLMVGSAVFWLPDHAAPLQRLGDESYALYLSHRFSLRLTTELSQALPIGLPLWAFTIVALISAIWAARLVHKYVELPLRRPPRWLASSQALP